MAIEFLSDVNFHEIIQNKEIALIDFYASWCGHCKMLSVVLEQIAKENPQLFIGKVNIDFEKVIAKEYDVWTMPTLIVFKKGKEVKRHLGYLAKERILELIK